MAQITLRDYLQGTEDAIRDGRIDDAFDYCRNILAQYPESLEAQRLLGEAYLAQGHLEEALQSFDWILTNDPENVVVYCDRALISESSSDYDTALDCYQQAYELSHGNSQIRQEFNRLSAKSGQQGFMFSRAGLARLYMRGDLLTQAIQEWETVLALSPERLDARTGLLETCWREAQYDRVEQLSTQILQDVPGCLKALLLLAYVSSTKNIQKTQELLKQASALDPDLLLAQEIFSDLMASQPVEPFLLLLKRAPALIEITVDQPAMTSSPDLKESQVQPSPIPVTSPALAPFVPAWNERAWADEPQGAGSSLSQATSEELREPAPYPMWSAEMDQTYDAWGMSDGPQEARSLQELRDFSAHLKSSPRPEKPLDQSQPLQSSSPSTPQEMQSPATELPQPSSTMAPENVSQEADLVPFWDNSGSYDGVKEPNLSNVDIWGNNPGSISESGTWIAPTQEGSQPTPPAWLNMLTQSERRQLNDNAPVPSIAPTPPVQEPVASTPLPKPVQKEEPKPVTIPDIESDDDQESFSFGPEWLKSLGAAAIDEASPAVSASLPVEVPQPVSELEEKQPVYESNTYEPQPAAFQVSEDESQLAPFGEEAASSSGTAEYNLLTTLEGLEAGLLSQGFVPMEPNSLLTIAKNQEGSASPISYTPEPVIPQEEEVYRGDKDWSSRYQNEPLPSALAELGGFVQEPVSSNNSPSELVSSLSFEQQAPNIPLEEPRWLADLNTATPSDPVSSSSQPKMDSRQEELHRSSFSPIQPSWDEMYTQQASAHLSSTQEDVLVNPEVKSTQATGPLTGRPARFQEKEQEESTFDSLTTTIVQPSVWSQRNRTQEGLTAQSPAASTHRGTEASKQQLDTSNSNFVPNSSELEMTMKRPAVRLQPIQQSYPFVPREPASPSGRDSMPEQPYSGKILEGNLSYQDRLLRGYQHQLVGDYDEAMQEYRMIIRSSPELLGEVVSNVRALLKLAPKYSTGYRVLGDAYMRQGEYLLAMEAYNKALTMAKRAKS